MSTYDQAAGGQNARICTPCTPRNPIAWVSLEWGCTPDPRRGATPADT